MAIIPAVCQACGTVFSSGISIVGGSAMLTGNTSGPCPKCGNMGIIPDGVYDLRNKAFSFFKQNQFSVETLKEIYTRLLDLDSESVSEKNLIEKIPELAPLILQFKETGNTKSLNNACTILTLLLSIISVAIALHQGYLYKQPQTEGERVMIEQLMEMNNTLKQQHFQKKEKSGRNDICSYCGSGKKYKKCCGRFEKRKTGSDI